MKQQCILITEGMDLDTSVLIIHSQIHKYMKAYTFSLLLLAKIMKRLK